MDKNRHAVADTALLVAAIRARETERADRLFADPLADRLATPRGHELLNATLAASGERTTAQIVVRTRFLDDALLRVAGEVRQIVILAAGMDARAYRLPWPEQTVIYEVDQPHVVAAKTELLDGQQPRCRRISVGIDLAGDWPDAIDAAGLEQTAPTVWLIEGLLQYLDRDAVATLFERIDALSAPGSTVLYDVVGQTLLESPMLAGLLRSMAENGAPWLFGTDDPGELVQRHGWTATVVDIATVGNDYGRWFAAAEPTEVAGVPRGYFVEATK